MPSRERVPFRHHDGRVPSLGLCPITTRYTFAGPTFDGPVRVTSMDFLPSLQAGITHISGSSNMLVHSLPAGVLYKVGTSLGGAHLMMMVMTLPSSRCAQLTTWVWAVLCWVW